MRLKKTLLLLLPLAVQAAAQPADAPDHFTPTTQPCFQVDYASPTADKPQSKLWFMDGCWWALLPRASGPSLWQRTDAGWKEHTDIAEKLSGIPGRADVWPDSSGVTAAGVRSLRKANPLIVVFRLERKGDSSETAWEPHVLGELRPPSPEDAIETATVMRDSAGTTWVAAVAGVKVCVWVSPESASEWSGPVILAEGVKPDDICVVTPLPENQIAVLWSDQGREAVLMRAHTDGAPAEDWREEEVVEMGNRTADDHLNTVLTPDGTLWVASKNEVDQDGKPQFVLRVRSPEGRWSNHPYGIRETTTRPSRPIAVAAGNPAIVFTGYGTNDLAAPLPHDTRIVFARIDPSVQGWVTPPRAVITPAKEYESPIQNVTGPRDPFPTDTPWIVLASDQEGRVYEADLRQAFADDMK